MALKYRRLSYRPWPVTVAFLDCDEATGQVAETEQSFIGHFNACTEADLLAARRTIFGNETDKKVKARLDDMSVADYAALEAGFFARLMCGWSALTDEAGVVILYTEAGLAEICTGPDGAAFRRGINRAIAEIRFGMAPAKNSSTSPAPGLASASGEATSAS